MGKKDRCAVFGFSNDVFFPRNVQWSSLFARKAHMNTERVPPGHPIILLKSNKFSMAAISVKRFIDPTLFALLSCFLNFQVLEIGHQSLNRNKVTAVNRTGQCMFCRTWNQHNFTKLWYVMCLKIFGCFVHIRCGNKWRAPCEVIWILKSGKFLRVESKILGLWIWNLH